jgi:NAD(P)-dependent dehydrogenase (short-subunit alcohol dehydrogenase family)
VSSYSLAGRAVLITGAARGIGAETARRIARRGGRVSLVGLEPELLEQVAAECGPEAVWFEADVTDLDSLERAVDGTVERLGGIDVAMANAGVGTGGTVAASPLEAIERTIEINLIGAIRTLKLCLPHVLERRGYLLPVASVAAIGQAPAMSAYCSSKAGLEGFANSLRIEVRHRGVDVGVAYFSWIDTEMVRGADEHRDFNFMRSGLRGPFAKTHPVSKAADAVIRGIERRSRWVAHPRWIKPLILIRGLVPFIAEAQVGDRMPELERLSQEEAERLGERASGPIGAGGEAAMSSPAAQR